MSNPQTIAIAVAIITAICCQTSRGELALAKRLVELQGGTITFESTRGIGSTFTVTLPKTGTAAD